MTSEERHEARYKRRVAAREKKRKLLNDKYGNFDEMISFDALTDAFYLCKKTVAWKASTQKYERNLFKNVYMTREAIYAGENISRGFHHFTLNERGKTRFIRSVHISERVVQKAVNRNCLLPILERSLIHDNGASLKGKGVDFTHRRLTQHLVEFYKEYEREGYVLLFDFSGYFDNILHEPIFEDLDRKIYDAINEFNNYKEEHKDLKKCEGFMKIELGINETEAEIEALRKYYNDTITDYNKMVKSFPSNIVGAFCHFKAKNYFDGKDMNKNNKDFKL